MKPIFVYALIYHRISPSACQFIFLFHNIFIHLLYYPMFLAHFRRLEIVRESISSIMRWIQPSDELEKNVLRKSQSTKCTELGICAHR